MARLKSTPATVPPMVISSGIMNQSKSMNVAMIISDTKIQYGPTRIHSCRNRCHTRKKSAAVNNSTSG